MPWACDVCLVDNEQNRLICVCCESPKPGAAPTITDIPTRYQKRIARVAVPEVEWECDDCDGVLNGMKVMYCQMCQKARRRHYISIWELEPSLWTCKQCGDSHDHMHVACDNCGSYREGVEVFAKNADGLAEWSCDVCDIANESDRLICQCCDSPKPGTTPVAPVSNVFAFGAPQAASTSNSTSVSFGAPTPSVSFGAPTPSVSFGAPTTPSVQFGAPTSPPPFKFGAPVVERSLVCDSPPTPKIVAFGAPAETNKTGMVHDDTTKPLDAADEIFFGLRELRLLLHKSGREEVLEAAEKQFGEEVHDLIGSGYPNRDAAVDALAVKLNLDRGTVMSVLNETQPDIMKAVSITGKARAGNDEYAISSNCLVLEGVDAEGKPSVFEFCGTIYVSGTSSFDGTVKQRRKRQRLEEP
ncbi:MAG: uncharacterized protein KVP18_000931 [Porospora cf. gigantea A]|uniref:uncharacterized protein n=1 Tax=Porospora cf. gigantea A TaxID=2853593 RepID=UPI0035596662|nr:MAG: hypothetical protein KVP18_000931 [Porospora cf. gigantea A]